MGRYYDYLTQPLTMPEFSCLTCVELRQYAAQRIRRRYKIPKGWRLWDVDCEMHDGEARGKAVYRRPHKAIPLDRLGD